jgi:ribosome-associated toxin RatA of RatAB toxin-antitoxin module
MTVIRRQALVARPPAALFALVNEVERYPKLFPWCQSVEVLEREPDSIAARLHVRAGGVGFSFATRNRLEPPELMRMQLLEGPLRRLDGEWRFTPYGDGGCRVALNLDFEPKSRLLGLATTLAFQRLADRLVEDFSAAALRELAPDGTPACAP